jgi:mRNA interferase MazF
MNPKLGEVWLADLGLVAKIRPVVIVSRNDTQPPRALIIYVPLTTQYRGSEYEVMLPRLKFLRQDSYANVQGLASIPTIRLERKLGVLPSDVMLKLKQALRFALDLETNS